MDVLLGIVGALIGGSLFHVFGYIGVTGLNLHSISVATGGAIVCLIAYHAVKGRTVRGFRAKSPSNEQPTREPGPIQPLLYSKTITENRQTSPAASGMLWPLVHS